MRATPRKPWQGLRTRRVLAAGDPDAPPRTVELPSAWDDDAAAALANLAPGSGPVSLRAAATAWLDRLPPELRGPALDWLLTRRAAPDDAVWAGEAGGFVLNLAAFDEPGLGLDARALAAAAAAAAEAARALSPGHTPTLRVTDLDGLLAAAGLDYASPDARAAAASVMTRLQAASPARLIGGAGVVDALLGVDAGGIAPRFDWLDPAGRLSRGARAMLAARGQSAEAALAAMLAGGAPLRLSDAAAHAAMRATLTPFLTLSALAAPEATTPRREPPARPGGYARRVTLGGHKLFVRTGEFADGTLGEVSLGLPKESAAVRAMADSLSQVISLALQHGTPLAELVELLAGTRFGPSGAVEGDPDVARASSPLDYLARGLAAAYLPGLVLEPVDDEAASPPLPLDLPAQARPALRIVR